MLVYFSRALEGYALSLFNFLEHINSGDAEPLGIFFFMISLLIFINIVLSANIKGTILDSESNEPLIGANVYIKDTSKGSATDADGSYFIADVRR